MYAKLFASILDSSLWTQPLPVRVVWITMLAMADREGHVYASRSGLSRRALVSQEDCDSALERFENPDAESSDLLRNPANEGRKIETADGGWRIINYPYYRGLQDAEERREANRLAKQRQRERERAGQQESEQGDDKSDDADVSSMSRKSPLRSSSDQAQIKSIPSPPSVETPPAKSKRTKFVKPTADEVKVFFEEWKVAGDPAQFLDHHESHGWAKIKNWQSAARNWGRMQPRFHVERKASSRAEVAPGKYAGLSKEVKA